VSPTEEEIFTKDFVANVDVAARYVRILGKNLGVCPDWHKGAGSKAWLFADEIILKTVER
jgi:hypothetical protein